MSLSHHVFPCQVCSQGRGLEGRSIRPCWGSDPVARNPVQSSSGASRIPQPYRKSAGCLAIWRKYFFQDTIEWTLAAAFAFGAGRPDALSESPACHQADQVRHGNVQRTKGLMTDAAEDVLSL